MAGWFDGLGQTGVFSMIAWMDPTDGTSMTYSTGTLCEKSVRTFVDQMFGEYAATKPNFVITVFLDDMPWCIIKHLNGEQQWVWEPNHAKKPELYVPCSEQSFIRNQPIWNDQIDQLEVMMKMATTSVKL